MFKSVSPIQASRSLRFDRGRGVTTAKAGKLIPLRYIPVLREDRLKGANISLTMELAETVRPLINAVYADVQVWFVPFAAFDRFADLGDFNRSYAKVKDPKTDVVEPFITSAAYAQNYIWTKMGVHAVPGTQVNMAPVEAYNTIVNHLYAERSPNLTMRTALDTSLATCFWVQNRFSQVVPNYDRSLIDGIVPLESDQGLSVKGIGIVSTATASPANKTFRETGSLTPQTHAAWESSVAGQQFVMEAAEGGTYPRIRAVVDDSPVYISLANIDLARKTAAFDALRKRYEGHQDAEIIEMLMEGIRVPEFLERQPMLLAARRTQFSFGTRYATDGASLDTSVTNGVAQINMSVATPRSNTGGVIMVLGSVVPDQMFERRADPFLTLTDQDLWPKYERDTLDVEKVDQVLNSAVDTSHASPSGIFGYEPMNYRWNRDFIRLGGDLYRPSAATPWDEDRAVLWVTEPVNPSLTADWYLATNVNADPFADRLKDHLTITTIHDSVIEGHTVMGPTLLEIPAEA